MKKEFFLKKHFIQIKIYALLILILISALTPLKAMAVDWNYFANNDILFYNPDDTTGCPGTSPNTSVNLANLKPTPTEQQIFQLLINGGMNAGQAAAIMGNMYAESGFNSDRHEVGNDIGYGLVMWSFGRRTSLESFAASKGVPNSDIPMQIEFLLKEYNSSYKSSLNGTAFQTGTNISESTKAWMVIFEAPLMSPANDPAALNSKRIPAAEKIYGFYSNLVATNPNSSSSTVTNPIVDGCNNSGNGAVAGNLVQTALNFALSQPAGNGMTSKSDATQAYQQAKQQYNPSVEWTDCGGFVATVMKASGIDSNYPSVGVSNQEAYIKQHSNKYQIINNPSVSNLQPGDILIVPGEHTAIYTGNTPYPMVDASLGQRVPSVRPSSSLAWVLGQSGTIIVRTLR